MKKFNFLENLLRKKFAMSGMREMNGLRADAANPDSQPTVNRQSRLTSEQRHYSVTSARVAQEWLKDKLVNLVKMVMQFFATSATSASANFVGKESNESTVMYRVKSRIPSCLFLYSLDSHLSRFSLVSLICLCMLTLGSGNAWGAKITDYNNIVSGTEYYIGATTSSSDYYWKASQTNEGTGLSGTAVTSKASATIVILEGSGTSWKIKIKGTSNYVTLANSKANGKFNIATSSNNWTFSNVNSLIKMLYTGSYCLQKNNSGTQFGSYGGTQTNVWLEEAEVTPSITSDQTSLDWGTVLQGSSPSTKTITITGANLTAGTLTISATGGYSVTPTSKSVSGTLAATTLTVTPPSTATAGAKNGKVTISGGGLTSAVEVNLSMTVQASHTVTLMDNGATLTEESAGAGVTLPSREGCKGYTFAGWTKTWVTAQTEWTTTAPTIILAGNYTPAADESLYPVYTKTEGGGSSTASSESISSTSTSAVTLETSKPITYTCSTSNTYSNPARIYKGNSITIAGGTITSISLTGVSDYAISNMTANTGTLTPDGNNGTWTGSASSVKFTASTAQTRISAISVTYAGGSTTSYISEANCCSLQAATSVRVTDVAATSVTLGWTAPSPTIGITKLQVVDGNGTIKVDNLAANATSATVTGLTECESYSFHIVSVGSSCNVSSASVSAQPYSGAKTVTYNYHEGTGSPASFTTDCSHTSTTLPTPTRANYRFDGWYTSASGGTRKGGGGDSYTPDATIELHAQWTRVYTVSYDYAGGSGSCVAGGPYAEGETVTTCAAPTRSGYTFKGWSDGVTTYNAGSTISNVQNDIVLTAQWTADTYTITYNGVKPGAENNNPTSYTVEDLPINLVAATHDQWRFDGWTDDNAGNADITTIPAGTTGNQSFTAHWTKRYAVTWYEESTPTIEYYDPGTTLQFPADPSAPASCSEKKFVGWMEGTITGETDDKPTFITAGEVNADAAYHAVWATQYEESGTKTLFSDQLLVTGTAAVSTPRDGWSSISYAYGYDGNGIRLSSSNNGASMTVDLSGKELGSTLTITFDAAKYGNEKGALSLSCLDDGANPTFSPASFTISNVSWEEKSCTITNVDENVKSITLTGTKDRRFYMKNFKVTTSGMITKYKEYSTSCCDNNVAAPSVTATATRNSITLSWANVTDATGYKVTINGGTHEVTTAACTYTESGLTSGTDYAWTVVATYNPANYCGAIPTKNTTTTLSVYGVTYNRNTTIGSGTVTMSPMPSDVSTYVVGETVTAAAKPTTCTNSGYTFNGWNTEPDGTGTHVDAEGTIAMVEGGLTLYAEWVAKRAYYVDRMHGQGDQTIEIGGKTYHCYYGDGYHTTPSPSDQKSGDACQAPHYRFVRWLTIGHINADGTQKDTGGAVGGGVQRGTVTDGETYYAIWEEEIE